MKNKFRGKSFSIELTFHCILAFLIQQTKKTHIIFLNLINLLNSSQFIEFNPVSAIFLGPLSSWGSTSSLLTHKNLIKMEIKCNFELVNEGKKC